MSDYQDKSHQQIQEEAEAALNSRAAKTGHSVDGTSRGAFGASDSTAESGVDEAVKGQFPGADVRYGSAASGAGNNREIPLDEGGDINPNTGKLYKARDFEGEGGPETKAAIKAANNPGSDDVRGNIRQEGAIVDPKK